MKLAITKPQSPASSAPQTTRMHPNASPSSLFQPRASNAAPLPFVQPKLTSNQPGDEYEQEADRVAGRVTQSRNTGGAEKSATGQSRMLIQRVFPPELKPLQRQVQSEEESSEEKREEDDEVEKRIQKKGLPGQSPQLTPKLFHRLKTLFGRGRPLPETERKYFETRFGHDFGKVRVHNNPESAELAADLRAQAFTHGHDIFFGLGQYRPETSEGKFLIAHELTHVVQQRVEEMPIAREPNAFEYRLTRPEEAREVEAEQAAANSNHSPHLPFGITLALPSQTNGVIARRSIGEGRPRIEEEITLSVDELVEWVLTNWRLDPADQEGGLRRRLALLNSPLREAVLQKVRSRLSAEQWQRLDTLLHEPESANVQEPSEPRGAAPQISPANARQTSERRGREQQVRGFISLPEDFFSRLVPEETRLTEQEAVTNGATAPYVGEPEARERLSQVSQRAADAEARLREATEESQRAQEAQPTEAPAQEEAVTKLETPAAEAVEEPDAAAAETGEVVAQSEAKTAVGAASIGAGGEAAALEPSPEAEEAEAARTEERMAQARRSEPAEEELEVEEEGQEELPESPSQALNEEAQAEEAEPEEEAAPPETESTTAIAETAPSFDETETAPNVPTSSEVLAPEPQETAAPELETESPEASAALSEADASSETETFEEEAVSAAAPSTTNLLESGEQQAALATLAEPVEEGGEAIPSSGGGGGGGAAIPEPAPVETPDVSQLDPAQAMASVANLPPAQMQSALGSVSTAASSSVNEQREELAATPPQMERPSGAPTTREQVAAERPTASTNGRANVERAPAGQARPTPQPAPLPAPPAPPTQAVREPRARSDEQGHITAADAQRIQTSLSRLPITDPGMEVSAGPAPSVRLEGNANPELAREQRLQVERSMNEAHAQGQRDMAQPMGENEIYPEVPQETLRAQIPVASGGRNGAATSVRGTGAATAGEAVGEAAAGDDAVAIIAQEERGEEVRAAATQAQSDMAAQRQEHETQAAQERERSQQEVAQLERQNASEQAAERASAQQAVSEQRSEWSAEQRNLVERNRTEADHMSWQSENEITREQTQANRESAQHIEQGEQRAAEERRRGEQNAESERRRGEEEASGGIFSWFADQAKAFFNRVKEGIKAAFEAARAAVRAAIEGAKRLAVAAIERARQAIVSAIRAVGNALIAIGNVVLAGFPGLRDRWRSAIEERVARAEAVVNALADRLKEGVQRALDALGATLDAALGLLERGLLAAVDVVGNVVQGAINFAKSVAQALAAFAALIKDIASGPIQWIRNLGASAWDGVRNHLWTAFKEAIKNWFNQKLEEVLGLGLAIWNFLRNGGIQIAQVGQMAWEALKSAIPTVLIQILIEKLVSLIIPAAGAVMAIIEGLQAAWGTVSRILQAIEKFFAFLKAVKSGNAGQKFAQAVAAAAIVVIDFVANWLLRRLRRPAGRVAGRLRAIAQRIMQRLRSVARRVGGALRRVGRRIRRGFRRMRARVRRRFGRRGGRRRDDNRRRGQRERAKQQRLDRAVAAIRPTLNRLLRQGTNKRFLQARLLFWKVRYRLSSITLNQRGDIVIRINPGITLPDGKILSDTEIGRLLIPVFEQAERDYVDSLLNDPNAQLEIEQTRERVARNEPRAFEGTSRDVQQQIMREGGLSDTRVRELEQNVNVQSHEPGHLGRTEVKMGRLANYQAMLDSLRGKSSRMGVSDQDIASLLIVHPSRMNEELAAFGTRLQGGSAGERASFLNTIRRASFLTQALEPAREPGIPTAATVSHILASRGDVGLTEIMSPGGEMAPMTSSGVASRAQGPQQRLARRLLVQRVGRIFSFLLNEAKKTDIIVAENGYDLRPLADAVKDWLRRKKAAHESPDALEQSRTALKWEIILLLSNYHGRG